MVAYPQKQVVSYGHTCMLPVFIYIYIYVDYLMLYSNLVLHIMLWHIILYDIELNYIVWDRIVLVQAGLVLLVIHPAEFMLLSSRHS